MLFRKCQLNYRMALCTVMFNYSFCYFKDKQEDQVVKYSDDSHSSIQVGNSDIPFITHARNLGITISSNTTMEKRVTNICRSTYADLWCISNIHHLLTVSATKTLLCAFVLSVLEYCNSPLWLTSIHYGQASKGTKFCSKISHEIL